MKHETETTYLFGVRLEEYDDDGRTEKGRVQKDTAV